MNEILTIKCARIKEDIERYKSTGIIPISLRDGVYKVSDISDCQYAFSNEEIRLAEMLIAKQRENAQIEIQLLKEDLRKEYTEIVSKLETTNPKFMFPTILGQHRPDINPVRALYYEVREMMRNFLSKNGRHLWLLYTIQDLTFNTDLLSAIAADIASLKFIVKKYNTPLLLKDNAIPLELFHAKQEIKEFKHYYAVFKIARDWIPY